MTPEEEYRLRNQRGVVMSSWQEGEIKEQYEYKTIQILPGAIVWEADLNRLGGEGYRLIAVVPLTQVIYTNAGETEYISNGTDLIFERRKETE